LAPDEQAFHALAVADDITRRRVRTPDLVSANPHGAFLDTVERDRRFHRHEVAVERRQGREEGRKEGREEGREATRRQLALKLLADGMSIDKVADLIELPRDEVAALASASG
jgi:hypothetical protein